MPLAINLPTINAQLLAFIASAKAKAAGGLTLTELKSLTFEFVSLAMTAIKPELADGAAKKQFVLDWVAKFYDSLAPLVAFVPLPGWLAWLRPLLAMLGLNSDYVRSIVLAEASAVIEIIYAQWVNPPLTPANPLVN